MKPSIMEFRVLYKSNGVTPDEGRGPVKPGMHARFTCEEGEEDNTIADVNDAVAKCKKFFNENTTVKIELDDEGFSKERKEVFTTKVKEIVHVWVDTYRDGVRVTNGDPTCEEASNTNEDSTPKSASRRKSLATASTEEV